MCGHGAGAPSWEGNRAHALMEVIWDAGTGRVREEFNIFICAMKDQVKL